MCKEELHLYGIKENKILKTLKNEINFKTCEILNKDILVGVNYDSCLINLESNEITIKKESNLEISSMIKLNESTLIFVYENFFKIICIKESSFIELKTIDFFKEKICSLILLNDNSILISTKDGVIEYELKRVFSIYQ